MTWWNPFKRQRQIEIVKRERSLLRLSEWQSSAPLVKVGQLVLQDPNVRLMLDVLGNEHPSGIVYADGTPHDVRVVAQARAEGYTMCLSNFEALGKMSQPREMPEETFGAKEIE